MYYDTLTTLLMLSLIGTVHKDQKHRKKLCLKLTKKVAGPARHGVLTDAIEAGKYFQATVNAHYESFVKLNELAAESDTLGACGMILVKEDACPVILEFENEDDLKWAKSNEDMFALELAHRFMDKFKIDFFEGDVTLFRKDGYSGIRHPFKLQRGGRNIFSISIGTTPYFYQPLKAS